MRPNVLVLRAEDNVATCLGDVAAGTSIEAASATGSCAVILRDDIAFGHKFALSRIEAGAKVVKYGEVIGVAATRIEPGSHVHVHNVESVRARGDKPAGDEA